MHFAQTSHQSETSKTKYVLINTHQGNIFEFLW